ncbi:unnamed protein product, partial [Meganyctiphanes norvegica]
VSYCQVVTETSSTFWNSTSIAGICNSAAAKNPAAKLIWLSLFIGGISITAYDVTNVFLDYFSYPYSTQVTMTYKSSVEFPAVTVCNQNRVSCEKLHKIMVTSLLEDDQSD